MRFVEKELIRVLRSIIPIGSSITFGPDKAFKVISKLQPTQTFPVEGISRPSSPSNYVILLSWLEELDDVYIELENLHNVMDVKTRLVVITVNRFWSKLLPRFLSQPKSTSSINWIPPNDLQNLLEQCNFELISLRRAVLLPFKIPLVSRLLNKWLSDFPLLKNFAVFNIFISRDMTQISTHDPSVSIIVAARNERDNIVPLVQRIPQLAVKQELIFVEGGSTDGTWDQIEKLISERRHPSWLSVQAFKQRGIGKGDAIRLGFENASGDILLILDADLSVPPEELNRFVELLKAKKCEFANGSRLLYPMEDNAMQLLNMIGNRIFGLLFTFLLGQSVRDTLCGTKVLWREDYSRIAQNRLFFGDFDPFGDFDLLFGASRLGLKIRDVPVHYKQRVYGSTNISRFSHGVLLIRMAALAATRLKFV